jgi:uncharacterized membrane protein
MRSTRQFAGRQRGSIIVFAAIGLSVIVITLSLANIGFLYYYKREYQKAADLAAMAGARNLVRDDGVQSCAGVVRPIVDASVAQNLGSFDYTVGTAADEFRCGRWDSSAGTAVGRVDNTALPSTWNAVFVTITGAPPRFLPFVDEVVIKATASAIADQPMAQLRIRSTLVSIDTSQSAVLNSLFSGLLGGNVSLTAAGWNGLVGVDINLLSYLDALALDLGIQVGDYDQLLQTEVEVGDLVDVAIDLLERGEATGSVSAALVGLDALQLGIPPTTPPIALGDLIAVGTGTPTAGLDAAVQLFQLVQAFVQAANSENALAATINLGVANVQVKVLEPPRISAVGNPELARSDPNGPDRIYVNTAQVRALISVNLPALSGVTNLANALLSLASPVTDLLNNIFNLGWVLQNVLFIGTKNVTNIQVVPGNPRIDVSLDIGGGEAKVTDYDCTEGQKSLDADIETSLANLRIGRMQTDPNQPGYVFASDAPPAVSPVPLIDVGSVPCSGVVVLGVPLVSCNYAARQSFAGGGLGIMAQASIAGTPYTHTYVDPPDLGLAPLYADFDTQNIVGSLANTLAGVDLTMYGPQSGGLGGVLSLVAAAYNTVRGLLEPVIDNLLSPLLDPLVNLLLDSIGLDLNQVEVGSNLSCEGGGATLID